VSSSRYRRMITFLTSAKSFIGPNRDNQLRALTSWFATHPEVEVILYGQSEGADAVCSMLGARYVPDIASSPSGVPLFNAIVEHAAQYATYDTQIYANCDILFSSSIAVAVAQVKLPRYLMIGQRLDLHQEVRIDVTQPAWYQELPAFVRAGHVTLHPTTGKDYFIFPRSLWQGLLPAVIGRAGYDDALLSFCFLQKIPIIDATFEIMALHQFHDYTHVAQLRREVMSGPDAMQNAITHAVIHSAPEISDADWTLRDGQLQHTCARGDRLRALELFLRFHNGWTLPSYAVRGMWRLLTMSRLYTPVIYTLTEILASYQRIHDQKGQVSIL